MNNRTSAALARSAAHNPEMLEAVRRHEYGVIAGRISNGLPGGQPDQYRGSQPNRRQQPEAVAAGRASRSIATMRTAADHGRPRGLPAARSSTPVGSARSARRGRRVGIAILPIRA